jgi:hypothetical protein
MAPLLIVLHRHCGRVRRGLHFKRIGLISFTIVSRNRPAVCSSARLGPALSSSYAIYRGHCYQLPKKVRKLGQPDYATGMIQRPLYYISTSPCVVPIVTRLVKRVPNMPFDSQHPLDSPKHRTTLSSFLLILFSKPTIQCPARAS